MMEHMDTSCKNCGHPLAGNFCSHCGQRSDVHRITWHELAHQLPHAMFHVDDGLFFTLWELTRRPGYAVREYLMGKRKPHYNPVLLLIMSAGLCSILYAYFHISTAFAGVRLDRLEEESAMVAHKFFAIRLGFICLVCSLGDSLLFRRAGFTFPEIVIFNCFSLCGASLIQVLFVPILLAGEKAGLDDWGHGTLLLAVVLYLWWTRVQFFDMLQRRYYRWFIAGALLVYLLIIAWVGEIWVQPLLELF